MTEKTVLAQIEAVTPLTDSIVQLILKPNEFVPYEAGQYLQIHIGDEKLSYSIANAPLGAHHYELHIRHSRDNVLNQMLFNHIKTEGFVTIQLPFGTCSIGQLDDKRPIIFIAGGTGYAPVNAMIEHLLASDDGRPFQLFWGARSQSDLYLDEKVKNWQTHVGRFNYFSMLSDVNADLNPDLIKDTLTSIVHKQHPQDLKDWQIVISGPFDMVYNIRDQLVALGVSTEKMYSDAFGFEAK